MEGKIFPALNYLCDTAALASGMKNDELEMRITWELE